MNTRLDEAKDLSLYKALVQILSDYADRFPATGIDGYLEKLMRAGIKSMPSDKRAQLILGMLVNDRSTFPSTVTKLLNLRFADLDIDVRPIVKNGRKHEVANWTTSDGTVTDKVKDLINLDGKTGKWTDINGEKVTLLDFAEKKD